MICRRWIISDFGFRIFDFGFTFRELRFAPVRISDFEKGTRGKGEKGRVGEREKRRKGEREREKGRVERISNFQILMPNYPNAKVNDCWEIPFKKAMLLNPETLEFCNSVTLELLTPLPTALVRK
jgi:hypothetical protein